MYCRLCVACYELPIHYPVISVEFVQEAVRLIQAARREARDNRVDVTLQARLAEVEAQLTAALTKANRENGSVFLQARAMWKITLHKVMPQRFLLK